MKTFFETDKNITDCSKDELKQILYLLIDEGLLTTWGSTIKEEKTVRTKDKKMCLEFMREDASYYDEYYFRTAKFEVDAKKITEACNYFLNLPKGGQLRLK